MRDAQPQTIHLKDYQPPAFLLDQTLLHFELHEDHTIVRSTLALYRNPNAVPGQPLTLDGEQLELRSLAIDGRSLAEGEYIIASGKLTVDRVPERFTLQCETKIDPQDNTSLEGLYKSRTMFCTQCEAEGFRKITFYPDRPDVMSVFTVEIEADATRYPVLLSNGNRTGANPVENGRHKVTWHDPHPKPSYLFALVAGDLGCVSDRFQTCSGREVALHVYVENKDIDKCEHAMESLKRSMRWDEEVFGREYDLDIFNIVAVDDFNMGAMENKSLNIFNTSCVLAHPDTTTDATFQTVEAIVAHEYFHNWSGNRVTCRDWFQLSLKEGFTVFRDAEFSSDMGSRTVKRVQDVGVLRTAQFAEDAGPMAHPVRPESFIEISNFYTVTVYEKGAEVVRMIQQLLGPERFRAGSDLYFARHDGQAVTCEDFVCAMEEASGADLTQFRLWYSQAGTPRLTVRDEWNEQIGEYRLRVSQACPATPGQKNKKPLVIPLTMGLLGEAGNLRLQGPQLAVDPDSTDNTETTLVVDQTEQEFVFNGLPERPVPSLLRGFSAPVILDYPYSDDDLEALMSRDGDGFVRWDASQSLAQQSIARVMEAPDQSSGADNLVAAVGTLLADTSLDPAMVALMLALPPESYLAERWTPADVPAIHASRQLVRRTIGLSHAELLEERYLDLACSDSYQPSAAQIAARSLRNSCLDYLCLARPDKLSLAREQFDRAANMTDRLAALKVLVFSGESLWRDPALEAFYAEWQHEALVVNQWLQVQAMDPADGAVERVQGLMSHSAFDLRNPNKVRALIGGFANGNLVNFHRLDGDGYRLLADVILELDALNPQIAARLLTPLTRWRSFARGQDAMCDALQRILSRDKLSRDVFEVASKSLQASGTND